MCLNTISIQEIKLFQITLATKCQISKAQQTKLQSYKK